MISVSKRTRLVRAFIAAIVWLARRAMFLRNVDLGVIMTNNTERLLNLPGSMPFFPARATKPEAVEELLRRLHPIACDLIRLGPGGDGGYLVPDDLDGIEACFSPGVSSIAGFERDCAERGMKVFMADASVSGPPENHPKFSFIKKFIGYSTSGNFISLADWVNASLPPSKSDLILQIDIEGYEYETLLGLPNELLQRFRIIVVEFHELDHLFCEPVFAYYSRVFDKLLNGHRCVHIHPNNVCNPLKVGSIVIPQMAEFTFLRNDRLLSSGFATKFPHPLDCDNTARPPLHLSASCYRSRNVAHARST